MSPRTVGPWLSLLMAGCAGANKNTQSNDLVSPAGSPGLFVGRSQSGQVVVAASHYDAMNGLAVEDVDLGLAARKNGSGLMLCDRDTITGTHVPRWTCRYKEEVEQERLRLQDELARPRLSIARQSSGSAGFAAGAATRSGVPPF